MATQPTEPVEDRPGSSAAARDPPASGVVSAWATIKKHKVAEWAIAYIAFGYAALHGVEMLRDAYEWPVAVPRLAVLLLLLGFPVVVTLAWYHGHRARHRVSGPELLIVSLLLIIAGSFLWYVSRSTRDHVATTARLSAPSGASLVSDKSIAVLPFVDMSEKHDQEYFGDGMAEEVIDLLVRIPDLRVIGRTSSFQFKGRNQDLRTVGSALGVNYVVEGSVRRTAERLRVTAQLIRAQDGSHLWSDTYDVAVGDALSIQDQIASNLVRALQVSVGAGNVQERPSFKSAEAYDLYLRGLHSFDRLDKEGLESAASYFQQVLDEDPSSAPAADWFAQAQVFLVYDGFVEPREGYERAREAAHRALALNPKSSKAYEVLATLHSLEWDWAAAERDTKESLRLNARNSGAIEHLARIYMALGRWDEAESLFDRAISLDPFDAQFHFGRGMTLSATSRLADAEAEMREALQISPTRIYGHLDLGVMLLREGKMDAALAEMQLEQFDVARDFGLAEVYDTMHRRVESDAALARLIQSHAQDAACDIALIYAFRQQPDEAFSWFERAYRQKDEELGFIKIRQMDPRLKRIAQDPRFTNLLRKMNLPE